jgi:hypothetical protein
MPQENDTVVETTNAKPQEDWMARRWRPAMGWLYMAVCAMDFMIFPVLWSVLQSVSHGQVTNQWQPLTLQGAGLFHLAMGAVLGIAAYGRTQEKMAGANNGGLSAGFGAGAGTTYVPPNATTMNTINQGNQSAAGGFNSGSSFGAPATGFGAPSAFGSAPVPAFGTATPTCSTTGRPLGPAQSFPAL